MIRRLARILSLLAFPALLGACVQVTIPGNVVAAIFIIPVMMDDGEGRMQTSGGYYDTRWYSEPDSHPAVRARPGAALPDTNGIVAPQPAPSARPR